MKTTEIIFVNILYMLSSIQVYLTLTDHFIHCRTCLVRHEAQYWENHKSSEDGGTTVN